MGEAAGSSVNLGVVEVIAAQPADWWDLVPALGGAIIGALAGGIPAWWLARRNSNEVLARDAIARKENEKAAAFRVFVKLLTLTNSVHTLRNHVRDSLALRKTPEARGMEPWMVVQPMVGFADEGTVHFEPDELAIFYAAGEREFLADLMLMDRRHAAAFSAFLAYCERREAFVAVAPTPDKFDGAIGGADLSKEELMRLRLYTIPLNNILDALAPNLEEDWLAAKSVARRFGPIAQRYFNDPSFVRLEVPED